MSWKAIQTVFGSLAAVYVGIQDQNSTWEQNMKPLGSLSHKNARVCANKSSIFLPIRVTRFPGENTPFME